MLSSGEQRPGVRMVAAALALVVGIGLIVLPFATNLFDRTVRGERVLDRYRSVISDTGFAEFDAIVDNALASGPEVFDGLIPTTRRQLHLTPKEFDQLIRAEFPTVASGLKATPAARKFVRTFVKTIADTREKFLAADDTPTSSIALGAVPWMLMGAGIALIAAAILALTLAGALPTLAVGAIGVALFALPLIWSLPSKVSDADDAADVAAASILNRQITDRASGLTALVDEVVQDIQVRMIPTLAQRLHTSPGALSARIGREYPATAKLLARWPAIGHLNFSLVEGMSASYEDLREAKKIPFKALPWFAIGPGILLTFAAGAALLASGRQSRVGSTAPAG